MFFWRVIDGFEAFLKKKHQSRLVIRIVNIASYWLKLTTLLRHAPIPMAPAEAPMTFVISTAGSVAILPIQAETTVVSQESQLEEHIEDAACTLPRYY